MIFIPKDIIISCMSSYTFIVKCICPTIQNGIDKFAEIQVSKYTMNFFITKIVKKYKKTNHPSRLGITSSSKNILTSCSKPSM